MATDAVQRAIQLMGEAFNTGVVCTPEGMERRLQVAGEINRLRASFTEEDAKEWANAAETFRSSCELSQTGQSLTSQGYTFLRGAGAMASGLVAARQGLPVWSWLLFGALGGVFPVVAIPVVMLTWGSTGPGHSGSEAPRGMPRRGSFGPFDRD